MGLHIAGTAGAARWAAASGAGSGEWGQSIKLWEAVHSVGTHCKDLFFSNYPNHGLGRAPQGTGFVGGMCSELH